MKSTLCIMPPKEQKFSSCPRLIACFVSCIPFAEPTDRLARAFCEKCFLTSIAACGCGSTWSVFCASSVKTYTGVFKSVIFLAAFLVDLEFLTSEATPATRSVWFYFALRQPWLFWELTMSTRLTSDLQRSTCLCLTSAQITVVHHHAQLSIFTFYVYE